MLIFPQWPLVVTATMSQFPSNWAAFAVGAEQMIAKAVDTAKAPIMGASFYLRCRFAQRARNVLMEQCAEFQAHLAPQRMHALWRSSNIRRVKRTAPPEILIFLL